MGGGEGESHNCFDLEIFRNLEEKEKTVEKEFSFISKMKNLILQFGGMQLSLRLEDLIS